MEKIGEAEYLKLMADYSSSGLWAHNGFNVEHVYAPISKLLSLLF